MADALEHTEATRRRLLADLGHELRASLATVGAYHEGIADGVVEADAPPSSPGSPGDGRDEGPV